MSEVINFFFQTWTIILNVIKSQWLLSVFLLISILSWIVSLVNQSKGNRNG